MIPLVFKKGLTLSVLAFALVAAMPADARTPQGEARYALRDQSSRQVRGVAENGLRSMVFSMAQGLPADGRLPADFPIAVGSYAELRQVTLGIGFEVNTIDPAALLYARRDADLSRVTRGTGIWNFVVLSKGQPVALLEVGRQDGRWQVLGAGATRLARDVQAAAQGHARDGAFRFVRVYQATADLMEVRGPDNRAQYVPLAKTVDTLPLKSSGRVLSSSAELLPSLQGAVRANLAKSSR